MNVKQETKNLADPLLVRGSQAPAIRTRDLSKEFGGVYAVHGVTFSVPRGSIFGFIGPSGSGKTTTIRMLTGYYRPSGGEVFVLDIPPLRFSPSFRERIGYMPQLFVLYPNLSVWENLNFAASLYGLSLFRKQRLMEVLKFVELDEHRNKLVRDISGGMQRRLSLAATLLHKPELIFLDEPTAGIDPVLRSKFWDHFRQLKAEGNTLFITTQYVGEAAYCDLIGVMDVGRLLVVDTPHGLRYRAFGGDVVEIRFSQILPPALESELLSLPFMRGKVSSDGDRLVRIVVDEARTAVPALIDWCRDRQVEVEGIEEYLPPFDDVFVALLQKEEVRSEKSA